MNDSVRATEDPFEDFDLICDFPWALDVFVDLKRLVRVVHQFMPHATDQQAVRLRARIKAETDPVAIGEFEGELEAVVREASTVMPRLVWGGILVSVYAAFEYGVHQTLNHWQATVGHPPLFAQRKGEDFLTSAEAYAQEHIRVPLFKNAKQQSRLSKLKYLRNSFVHNGSQLSTLRHELISKIEQKSHAGLSLEVVDGQWVANARSATFYLLLSETTIRPFGDLVLEKCLAHSK